MIGRIEVIEENAPDPPRFLPMGDIKVFVAPFLEGTKEGAGSVFVAGVLESLVEVRHVFVVEIRWGQIASPSEPPSDDLRWVFRVGDFEITVIRVDGRRVRVTGVDYQAETGGEKGEGSLRIWIRGEGRMVDPHLFDGGGGKGPMDDGNIDTSFFDNSARLLQSRRIRYGKYA